MASAEAYLMGRLLQVAYQRSHACGDGLVPVAPSRWVSVALASTAAILAYGQWKFELAVEQIGQARGCSSAVHRRERALPTAMRRQKPAVIAADDGLGSELLAVGSCTFGRTRVEEQTAVV